MADIVSDPVPGIMMRLAILCLICLVTGHAQAADDSIGLALEKLRLHMTMAEARAAYPALSGDPHMGLLTATYELDGCEFLLALEFGGNDSLGQVELDTAANVESCKTAIMGRLVARYGPSEKGCPIFANTIYMKIVGPLEIYLTDNRPGRATNTSLEQLVPAGRSRPWAQPASLMVSAISAWFFTQLVPASRYFNNTGRQLFPGPPWVEVFGAKISCCRADHPRECNHARANNWCPET